jgi:hypothetical protein
VAELSVFTWPGYTAGADLYDAVMQSVVEFAEEHPEAVQLIRGAPLRALCTDAARAAACGTNANKCRPNADQMPTFR